MCIRAGYRVRYGTIPGPGSVIVTRPGQARPGIDLDLFTD